MATRFALVCLLLLGTAVSCAFAQDETLAPASPKAPKSPKPPKPPKAPKPPKSPKSPRPPRPPKSPKAPAPPKAPRSPAPPRPSPVEYLTLLPFVTSKNNAKDLSLLAEKLEAGGLNSLFESFSEGTAWLPNNAALEALVIPGSLTLEDVLKNHLSATVATSNDYTAGTVVKTVLGQDLTLSEIASSVPETDPAKLVRSTGIADPATVTTLRRLNGGKLRVYVIDKVLLPTPAAK